MTFVGTQTADIECYYRAADVFMMLSAFDTFGMVVLEAMAAGLPVIVRGNVGAKDLVVEGENGFVVAEPQDAAVAAARLAQLLDANRCKAMGAASGRRALVHDWDAVVKELETVYQDALARRVP